MSEIGYPEDIEELISVLKTLPGVGRRGAERMALAMLKWKPEKQRSLGTLLQDIPEKVGHCPECGAIATTGQSCKVCSSASRDESIICVVEEPQQIFAIEKSGFFRGHYHVLGGRLSPMEMLNGESLNTAKLLKKVETGVVKEIILALSSDVEGRATSIYIANMLKDFDIVISQPASGLPAGANLAYADGATIQAALNGRQNL